MYPHHSGQGQTPQWTHQVPPGASQPPNGAYHPNLPQHPSPSSAQPPPTETRSDMATLQPQRQDMYRLPGPHDIYRGPPPDPYRTGPPSHLTYTQHQPAPRQRTAIACRYCRRRKIRCSGFDASEDGRCANCQRFSQECIFTPVSAQAQAFVPAQALWRGNGQPPPQQLYGAYGQPLPAQHQPEGYGGRQPGYPLPSPTGPYAPSGAAPYAPSPVYDDRSRDHLSRKRPATEPHTPTLPPPNPATMAHYPTHPARPEYTYPDPTALTPAAVSPASSNASYHSQQPSSAQQPQQPYYTTQPPQRRSSPQSAYMYDSSRTSSSPHNQGSQPGSGYPQYGVESGLRPPQTNLPLRTDGRTPPPKSTTPQQQNPSRPGMSIRDIVSGEGAGQGGRSAADSDMLKALNRKPM